MNYLKIQTFLIKWFKKHKRDLPWRKNRTWYQVWISEIMLQQTQVEQVKNYFKKFIIEFPTIEDLSKSKLQKVLKLWEGLGYYTRARNLHKASQIIVKQYKDEFPSTKTKIIQLPGIGEYTANAILSFVYNKPYSVVDGNVIRVISRIFGITDNIREPKTLKKIKSKTDKLMPLQNSAVYNEAIMELGALVCLPKNPNCIVCPIKNYCESFRDNLTNIIPFKSKGPAKPLIKVAVQIVKSKSHYLITKRKDRGLLGGYWEFPIKNIEHENELEKHSNKISLKGIKHSYTHFNLLMYPIFLDQNESKINNKLYVENKWVKLKKIKNYPIHKAMQKILNILENH